MTSMTSTKRKRRPTKPIDNQRTWTLRHTAGTNGLPNENRSVSDLQVTDQSTSAVSAMAASASDISTDAIALDFDSLSPRLRMSRSNGE